MRESLSPTPWQDGALFSIRPNGIGRTDFCFAAPPGNSPNLLWCWTAHDESDLTTLHNLKSVGDGDWTGTGWKWRITGLGERVGSRLRELAPPRGQREPGCGIHAT